MDSFTPGTSCLTAADYKNLSFLTVLEHLKRLLGPLAAAYFPERCSDSKPFLIGDVFFEEVGSMWITKEQNAPLFFSSCRRKDVFQK